MGNETEQDSDDKDFNRVRIGYLSIHPELSKTINNNTFSVGLFYQQYNVEETPGRFISDIPGNGLDTEIFEHQDYTGINARYQFDTRNSQILPTRGLYWNTNASFYYDLDHARKTFNQFISELSLFMSFFRPVHLEERPTSVVTGRHVFQVIHRYIKTQKYGLSYSSS